MTRAGAPTAIEWSGIVPVTTLLAPITTLRPIVDPGIPEVDRDLFQVAAPLYTVDEAEILRETRDSLRVLMLIRAYRVRGHVAADLDLDFILAERARELFGEGHRWFDLVRFDKLVEYVRARNAEAAPNIQDFHTLRPIPQSQIDLTINEGRGSANTVQVVAAGSDTFGLADSCGIGVGKPARQQCAAGGRRCGSARRRRRCGRAGR